MKQKNKIKRLEARQAQYAFMMSQPQAPQGHHKPGSPKGG